MNINSGFPNLNSPGGHRMLEAPLTEDAEFGDFKLKKGEFITVSGLYTLYSEKAKVAGYDGEKHILAWVGGIFMIEHTLVNLKKAKNL